MKKTPNCQAKTKFCLVLPVIFLQFLDFLSYICFRDVALFSAQISFPRNHQERNVKRVLEKEEEKSFCFLQMTAPTLERASRDKGGGGLFCIHLRGKGLKALRVCLPAGKRRPSTTPAFKLPFLSRKPQKVSEWEELCFSFSGAWNFMKPPFSLFFPKAAELSVKAPRYFLC